MLAPEPTVSEFTLPAVDVRSLWRRVALPVVLGAAAVAGAVLLAGHVHALAEPLRRVASVSGGWVALGAVAECVSLAGYVWLLSLVAGRASARIGVRESAQITLAGAAATRVLPTAGAGGAALALWVLRRAGLRPSGALRTLLGFLVLLYAVFLGALIVSGALLTFGLVHSRGPAAVSAVPAGAALIGIAMALLVGFGRRNAASGRAVSGDATDRLSRVRAVAELLRGAIRDACSLVRLGDIRLAGAIAYWTFDAAVLWAMLHAFGSAPALPVIGLAYLVGQVATTLPIPGSVSGGIAGVLIAFGVPAEIALPSVLAYRTIAVWLPMPVAVAALPGLRSTVARWAHEDA